MEGSELAKEGQRYMRLVADVQNYIQKVWKCNNKFIICNLD